MLFISYFSPYLNQVNSFCNKIATLWSRLRQGCRPQCREGVGVSGVMGLLLGALLDQAALVCLHRRLRLYRFGPAALVASL